MKNILYSTTRQWNPGDEFILFGVINIFDAVIGKHNALIYNRNPEIRPDNGIKGFRIKEKNFPYDIHGATDYVRCGFWDNSIKFDSDMSFADMAVFAGTPEWWDMRCVNFYEHIINNRLPTMFLGLGSIGELYPCVREVLSHTELLTFRDEKFLSSPELKPYHALALPCPAMQAAKIGREKRISEVKHIGLVFGVNQKEAVVWNCVPDDTYNFLQKFYKKFIRKYRKDCKISVVCHYIDELAPAYRIFADDGVDILYSYDSRDYLDIYADFDLVISPRVHGCGIAASLGIPSISIVHDDRGTTTKGFLSEVFDITVSDDELFAAVERMRQNIASLNDKLITHKKKVFDRYVELVRDNLSFEKVKYQAVTFPDEVDIAFEDVLRHRKRLWVVKSKARIYGWLARMGRGSFRAKYEQKQKRYQQMLEGMINV